MRVVGTAIVLGLTACAQPGNAAVAVERSGSAAPLQPVIVRAPAGMGGLRTGRMRADGAPETVACTTCHGGANAALAARNPTGGKIHGQVVLTHGNTTCLACHDRDDRGSLHLADGRKLAFAEVALLCGQCHGPQARDYEHGSHGGMMGYWDRTRGGRTRNDCVVCHAPHAPAYAQVWPAPPPPDAPATHRDAIHDDPRHGEAAP